MFRTSKKQSAPYQVVASMLTDAGLHREVNEDCAACVQPEDPVVLADKGMLVAVADGMGGHLGGELASHIAVEVITRVYYSRASNPLRSLMRAFEEANREIYQQAAKRDGVKGMGTTCAALVLQNGSAYAAYVGDSRIYLARGGGIYLMTQDHSAVMEMVKRGIIDLEAARNHAERNVVLRALGCHETVEVSVWERAFPVKEGDKFLLCSDGLYELVADEEMNEVVSNATPEGACGRLVEMAKERGGYDNITVGVASVEPHFEARRVPRTRQAEVMR